MTRGNVEAQHAAPAQLLEALPPGREQLLGGGPLVRPSRPVDWGVAGRDQRRIFHGHHQHQVAPGKPERLQDQVVRRPWVEDVGQHDDQRAAGHPAGDEAEGFPEVGLDVLGPDRIEDLVESVHLRRPALGGQVLVDLVSEGQQPHPVALLLGQPAEEQGRIDGMVELGEHARRRRHQPAAVEQEHHLLAALGLQLDRHRLVAAGGRFPVDAPEVVAGQVVAQAREGGGGARRPSPPLAGPERHAAAQCELVAADGQDVGIDGGLFGDRDADLAHPEAARTPAAEVQRAESEGAPAGGTAAVLDDQLSALVEAPPDLAGGGAQAGRCVVGDDRFEACRRTVPDADQDQLLGAQ